MSGRYLKPTQKKKHGFLIGMGIYALVFLILTGVGLYFLWDFMDAYEVSRPENTMDAYMAQLDTDAVFAGSGELLAQVDQNVQDEQAFRACIGNTIDLGVSYARKTSECTEEKAVYVLRCGGKVIGRVELVPQGETRYGFTPWAVGSDSFDLSHLLGTSQSITVPHDYQVYADSTLLDESYITETGIHYEALEDFYGDYELPYMVTYTTAPILGQPTFSVVDPEGYDVIIDENVDLNEVLYNCTQEELEDLDTFTQDFIKKYARYLSSTSASRGVRLSEVKTVLLKGSDLMKRVNNAYDGLAFGQTDGIKFQSIDINSAINIGSDRYICDVTYVVDIKGRDGTVTTVNNARVVYVRTDSGLKAEKLISY